MRISGALHSHTVMSHDGKQTIDELVAFLKERDYRFLLTSDHSQDVTPEAMEALKQRAAELSDDSFLVIPGIEFSCDGWIHILGFGVTETCPSDQPADVIEHIKAHGGLPILAHPFLRPYPLKEEWVKDLLGAEIWNTTNDSKYMPSPITLRNFKLLRRWNPGLRSYTGIDLHRFGAYYGVRTYIDVERLERTEILSALRTQPLVHKAPLVTLTDEDPKPSLRLSLIRLMAWAVYAARKTKHKLIG